MMSSSHSPPCEIQSDRSITMFSKNTTRVFRRRRREKKVSVASEETEREKETFERRRGNFSLDVLLQKSRPGEKFDSTDIRELENKTKEKETSFVFDAVVNEKESSSSKREEREREKKSIIIGCVPPKKGPDHPVFLLARGRVGKACLSVQSLFFEYSMSASKVCCKFR